MYVARDANQELVHELLRRVPEFATEVDEWETKIPYHAFGTFALLVHRKIRDGASEDFLQRACSLLDEMATTQRGRGT